MSPNTNVEGGWKIQEMSVLLLYITFSVSKGFKDHLPGSLSPIQCEEFVPFVEFPVASQSHGPTSYSVYIKPFQWDSAVIRSWKKWYLRTSLSATRDSSCQGKTWRTSKKSLCFNLCFLKSVIFTRGSVWGPGALRPSISGRWSSF